MKKSTVLYSMSCCNLQRLLRHVLSPPLSDLDSDLMCMFNMSITMNKIKFDLGASIYITNIEGRTYHRINHKLVHIIHEDRMSLEILEPHSKKGRWLFHVFVRVLIHL